MDWVEILTCVLITVNIGYAAFVVARWNPPGRG